MNAYEKNVLDTYERLRKSQERQGFAISRKAPMEVFAGRVHERLASQGLLPPDTTVKDVEDVLERLRAEGY